MATKTSNYEFNKPEQNDFYDVDVQNENWDKVDEELSEFDDSGVTEDIKSFPDFLSKFVAGNKVAITLRNLKAGLQFVLHAGQIVNNCVTDNTGLPLSAAQGKVLKDLIDTTNNNLSEFGNLRFLTANTFADAWNKAEAGYTYFIDITSNTDPPTTTANRWFGQMWKNDTGKYGWQVAWSFNGTIYKRERNNSDAWTDWNTYALKSDLDSSKLKSMTFTAMSDEYAQIAIGNPGILICAVSNNYLLARQDNGVCRVIGDIRNNELSFKRNVKVSGIAFYV